MAQVDTQSAFRHSSQHSNYYYPSTSSSHSASSSSSNSHHSSPRNSSVLPQHRYYSPSQHYSPEDHNTAAYHNPSYRSTLAKEHPTSSTIEEHPDESNSFSPFPAYDHAQTSSPLEAIEDDEEEEEYDELDEDENPSDSPNSLKSSSPSAVFPHISDDIWTERGPAPSRQVDYLSHDWQEPDIWSSWRYIRKEKAGYPQNAARLENASWRTWAKSKYKLKTITPETLNWLKDCDVTWLYGPLQSQAVRSQTERPRPERSHTEPTSPASSAPTTPNKKMSRSSSFTAPSKPILKKRSHSEVMLTSLSGTTQGNLLTRAAQAVQAERRREIEEQEFREEQRKNPLTPTHVLRSQQRTQRIRRRGSTDLGSISRDSPESPFIIPHISTTRSEKVTNTDYFGQGNWTSSSSGGHTPSASKHIHFNDRVEQCIAVDVKEDEEDTTAIDDESEDEGLFMKPKHYIPKPEHSTIAKLPATTLRPGDEPIREPPQVPFTLSKRGSHDDLTESGFHYDEGGAFSSSASPPKFPPPSQTQFPIDQDPTDDFSFDHPFASQSFAENIPSNNTSTTSSRRSSDFDLEDDPPQSQRRPSVPAIPIPIPTNSTRAIPRDRGGMMGEDDDDEGIGIVGLAADAISTAKDLVGVLWNAGWGGRR